MKKLLHERLREVQASTGLLLCNLLVKTLGIPREKTDICTNRVPVIAEAIADEIEKYYIPRPRFEDGEPVQFGDSFIQKCVNVEVELDKIGISLFTKDGLNMVWFPDEVVPRPEPKVLDADGVPCKKGETVYYAPGYITKDNKGPWKVLDIQGSDSVLIGRGYIPGEDDYMETVSGEAPDILTHREPDSLKKAVDDLGELLNFPMCDDIKLDKVEEVYNRLTAIMERDA